MSAQNKGKGKWVTEYTSSRALKKGEEYEYVILNIQKTKTWLFFLWLLENN